MNIPMAMWAGLKVSISVAVCASKSGQFRTFICLLCLAFLTYVNSTDMYKCGGERKTEKGSSNSPACYCLVTG